MYDQLPPDQRLLLRDLMLRLVSPSPEGEAVRGRVPRRQLASDPEHERLMERLVAARLVISDDGVVELAHEALARAWPRLRGWLDDDTEGQRILRHLSAAADTWQSMGWPDDELYRGARLAQALEWRDRSGPDLTPVEATFLDAAETRARAEEESALAQARTQARANRRLRGLLIGAAVLLVTALVAGGLAVRQANRAADAGEAADARRVAALSQLSDGVARSLRLALAAHDLEPSTETRASLLDALARVPQLAAVRPSEAAWLDVAPDGTVVGLARDNRVTFHHRDTLEELGGFDPFPAEWEYEGLIANGAAVEFSPDGEQVAALMLNINDAVVRLLDPRSFDLAAEQPGGQPVGSHAVDVDWSGDGRLLAVSTAQFGPTQGTGYWAYLWDTAALRRPVHRIELPSDTFFLELSPDGRRLYAAPAWNSDAPPHVRVYDTSTGDRVARWPRGGHGLDLSPDGRRLAFANEGEVFVSDARTGRVVQRLGGPQDQVDDLTWSPDGRRLAATSADPAAWAWDARSGRLLETIPLEEQVFSVRFDPTGRRLLLPGLMVHDLTGADRYVRRDDPSDPAATPETGGESRTPSPYAPVTAVSRFRPEDGSTVTWLLDRRTGARTRLGVTTGGESFTADGRFVFADGQGRLRAHDVGSGERLVVRRHAGDVLRVTRDGSRLLAEVPDGLVLLDARSLQDVTEPVSLPGVLVSDADLGPGDHTAVVVTAQATSGPFDGFGVANDWALIDLVTGERLREGRLRISATSMSVSPDARRLGVSTGDRVEIVDLATGESTLAGDSGTETVSEGLELVWSPDGGLLASTDGEGRATLRDGTTGEHLGTVHPGAVHSTPMFRDADTLELHYADGSVYTWDTAVDHAVAVACRIAGGGLTRTEWRAVFGSRPYEDTCG